MSFATRDFIVESGLVVFEDADFIQVDRKSLSSIKQRLSREWI